jgi:hypothetical protein
MLEDLMDELEGLSERSLLPDMVDEERCDNLLFELIDHHCKGE